jgi:hypothetical protein
VDLCDIVEKACQSHGASNGDAVLDTSRLHGGNGVGDHWNAFQRGKKLVVAPCEPRASACCQKNPKSCSAREVHK